MSGELQLLLNIQTDVLAIRQELVNLRTSLELAGLIGAQEPSKQNTITVKWTPPAFKKLGDMIRIIAESNPTTAAALREPVGLDPEWDPMKDKKDGDSITDQDKSTDADPRKRDADPKKDLWPSALGGDHDPTTPGDIAMTAADRKRDKKADPKPPKTDDDDSADHFRPDTEGPRDLPNNPT